MVVELGPVATLTDNLAFPEDPRWHKGHFYFADMLDRRVARIDHDGFVTTLATFEDSPSGIGFLPNGDMLVVSMYHEQLIRVDGSGDKHTYADLGPATNGAGVNDMVVDREGRAYVVQFGGDTHATPVPCPLVVVQPDGTVGTDGQGLLIGNGIRITDDGKTLVVAESAGKRISLFDIGPGGTLSNRRIVLCRTATFPMASAWTRKAASGYRCCGTASSASPIPARRLTTSKWKATAVPMPACMAALTARHCISAAAAPMTTKRRGLPAPAGSKRSRPASPARGWIKHPTPPRITVRPGAASRRHGRGRGGPEPAARFPSECR